MYSYKDDTLHIWIDILDNGVYLCNNHRGKNLTQFLAFTPEEAIYYLTFWLRTHRHIDLEPKLEDFDIEFHNILNLTHCSFSETGDLNVQDNS